MDTTGLTRKLSHWDMPDDAIEWLVRIYAHNRQLAPKTDQTERIGQRRIVAAIRERYGIGVSTHTIAKWFATNQEVLNANMG